MPSHPLDQFPPILFCQSSTHREEGRTDCILLSTSVLSPPGFTTLYNRLGNAVSTGWDRVGGFAKDSLFPVGARFGINSLSWIFTSGLHLKVEKHKAHFKPLLAEQSLYQLGTDCLFTGVCGICLLFVLPFVLPLPLWWQRTTAAGRYWCISLDSLFTTPESLGFSEFLTNNDL